MEAPIYPPASAFEQPATVRTELSIYNISIAELMAAPKAWELVVGLAPNLKRAAESSFLKPHLSNFAVASLLSFGNRADGPDMKKIDEAFRALPDSEKPAQ